jgi:hypothetical protein
MVLSKRERFILIGTLAALGVLALDRFGLSVLLDRRAAAAARRNSLASELSQAQGLMAHHRLLAPRWEEMTRSGLKDDSGDAESQVLHAIRDWAEEAKLSLSLLRPERLTAKTRLPGIAFQAAGTGTMGGLSRLLWRIQSASIPIKVTEVQVSTRKEGTDDLSFQLRLSTVYSPQTPVAVRAEGPDSPGGAP